MAGDELSFILVPQGVHRRAPGRTFRVLKEKQEKLHGEYHTRRLVLEAFDKLVARSRTAPAIG